LEGDLAAVFIHDEAAWLALAAVRWAQVPACQEDREGR